jgi:two-component system phosphate regulon response regulator PhoB
MAKEAKDLILIADDDPVICGALSAGLRARGFAVAVAVDVVQTMMAIRRTPPAAMILDIMMPGGTGLEVLRRIKALSSMQGIPVLAVSASTDGTLPEQTAALGADAFLHKPLDLDEVFRTLCRLLGRPLEPPPTI